MSLKDIRKQKQLILSRLEKIEAIELEVQTRILDKMEYAEDSVTGLPLSACNIDNAVAALADKIVNDPTIKNPVLVSVMDGAMPFAAALQAELNRRGYVYQYTTMQASSYHGTTSGQLKVQAAPKIDVAARHVLVIDEVCDTGKTYEAIRAKFASRGAKSTQLVVLVDKKQPRIATSEPWISGFIVAKEAFIIGKGLDFDGLLRNLDYIGVANLESLPTPAEKALLATKKCLVKELNMCLAREEDLLKQQTTLKYYASSFYIKLAVAILTAVVIGLLFAFAPLSILFPAVLAFPVLGIAVLCIPSQEKRQSPGISHAKSEDTPAVKTGVISIPEPVNHPVAQVQVVKNRAPVISLTASQNSSVKRHSMFPARKDQVLEEQNVQVSRVSLTA